MPFGPGGRPSSISNQKRRNIKQQRNAHKPGVRTPLQREADMAVESELYRQGCSIPEIAKKFGVSTTQIYRDIGKMRKAWLEAIVKNIDELKAEEIAKLHLLEREANIAWQRSTEDRVQIETTSRVAEAIAGKNPLAKKPGTPILAVAPKKKVSTEVMKREGQAGDPRFQMVILKCIELRAQLLGLTEKKPELPVDAFKSQDDARALVADRLRQLQTVINADQNSQNPPIDVPAKEVVN